MAVQTVFQRYEMKYLLTQAQRGAVLRALEPHMALDPYGRTVIRNLYLDTQSYRLIRRSFLRSVFGEAACRTPPPTGPASAAAFWARGCPGCRTPRKAAQGAGSFRLLLRSDSFDLQRSRVLSREAEADGASGQKSTVSSGKEKGRRTRVAGPGVLSP